MRKVNPEYAKAIMAIANRAPYLKLLGMKICELDLWLLPCRNADQ